MDVKSITGHEIISMWKARSCIPYAYYLGDTPCTGCWYPEKKSGDHFRKGEKLCEICDYFGRSLFVEYASEDGVLLYQCASLNIIEKGPMVTYGVPTEEHNTL